MGKKKIAFAMGPVYLGGAERALINMLKYFDYEHYDVVLWICGEVQGNIEAINKNVEIKYVSSEFDEHQEKKQWSGFRDTVKHIASRVLARQYRSDDAKNKHYYSISLSPITTEKYDCVIAYRGWDDSILRFAFNRLRAKKRIVWIHNDTYITDFPYPYYYQKADRIYCVSKTIKQHMLEKYLGLDGKLEVFYNILDEADIQQKALEECDIQMQHPAILSVGRLSWEKGFDIIPEVAALLRDKGYQFHWYIIGEGYKRRDIEPIIIKYHLEGYVTLLGARDNPYPFFRDCDIFVQTSLTEGYCITTAEAKLFCKPVVTTNIPVMHEQFINMVNGIIADDNSADSIFSAVSLLLSDVKLRTMIEKNLVHKQTDVSHQFSNFYEYIRE